MSEPIHHPEHEAPPRRRGPWLPLFIVAAVLLAALIGVLLWLVLRPSGTPTPTPSPTATASPTPSPTGTPAVAICSTANSKVTLGSPSGEAGHTVVPIVFTNTSSSPCTLEGYPTVEFVGDGNGTQIGASATQDTTTAPVTLVTLAPGGGAGSVLTVTDAGNVCTPVPVDGFRVIPPGSKDAFFVPTTDYPACAGSTSLLTVSAFAGP